MNSSYAYPLWQVARQKPVVAIVAVATLLWSLGLPFSLFPVAHAANLGILKDTITDSGPSVATNHVINFQATTTVTAGQTIKIQFDPAGDNFDLSTVVAADVTATGITIVANVGACSGAASEAYPTIDSSAPDENITLTVCAGDTVTTGVKTINVINSHLVNPAAEGSYVIRVTWGTVDSGDTRIAVINHVTLTASVDTTLTFTISGVAFNQSVNGDATTTATTTTATLMPFGTLASGSAKVLAQDLSVVTNARNGFVVTVIQNQNLLSSTGADIDLFKDGAANVVPTAWTAPLATLGNENTYGHYGITSEDADLNSDEFGTALYAGNFGTTTRQVFSNSGPADGVAPNIGKTRVGIKIQVSALQEAGNDYTNQLIYVCTPTF
jgi:hypothetical protein